MAYNRQGMLSKKFFKITKRGLYCAVANSDEGVVVTPHELYYGGSGDEEAHRIERRNKVRDDISRRLRNICANFSDEEFSDLVNTMTDRKLKGEQRGSM